MKKVITGLMVLLLAGLAMAETMTLSGTLKGDLGGNLRVRAADNRQINFKAKDVPAVMLEGLVVDGQVKINAEVKPNDKNPSVFVATEIISLEKQ